MNKNNKPNYGWCWFCGDIHGDTPGISSPCNGPKQSLPRSLWRQVVQDLKNAYQFKDFRFWYTKDWYRAFKWAE